MATCINCEREVTDNFCAHCGQRTGVKRITFREGWNDFWARVYGFDGMFPRTLKDLTLRPGQASRTFISGNRARYYGPVGYFFLMVSVLLLLISFLDIDYIDFIKNVSQSRFQEIKPGSGQEKLSQIIMRFMSDNFRWVAFALIPFQSFYARFLFFRKSGLNYIEHTVLPFYLQGHTQWLGMINMIVYKVSGAFVNNFFVWIISTLFFCYAYANFIDYQPKWKSFLKGFGIFYVSLVTFVLLAIIALFLLFQMSPDFYELVKPSNN